MKQKKARIIKRWRNTYLYLPQLNTEFRINVYGRHEIYLKFGREAEKLNPREIEQLAKDV